MERKVEKTTNCRINIRFFYLVIRKLYYVSKVKSPIRGYKSADIFVGLDHSWMEIRLGCDKNTAPDPVFVCHTPHTV